MHDIRFIRDNPDAFDQALARRGLSPQATTILNLDTEYRQFSTKIQQLQQKRNEISQEIGSIKKNGGNAEKQMEEVAALKSSITENEAEEKTLGNKLTELLLELPNILDDDVPLGTDESDNMLIRTSGEAELPTFTPKDHVALGEGLGMMDFTAGAKLSGSRFVVLKSTLAQLERALAAFMLNSHCNGFGYEEVLPPALVKPETMQGTGQLPKFHEDLFCTIDGRYLIPTAEVPLTNLVANEITEESSLPLRVTAYTPCFRAEAGAAGRDTRGMIRQHQFSKVELVSIVEPDQSADELERMTSAAEHILKSLDLSYRVMLLSSGDTGFSARRTYDIEVWLPGQQNENGNYGMYREISSCSNCGDFQARRMKARFRKRGEKETHFLHTLNGSGLAVGRTMIAILENYQNEDGSITIPSALRPYMNNQTKIEKINKV